MPLGFPSRRSRSMSVHRPTDPAPTNPALLAASQAFSTTPAGQKKLAQGAAATALRSMSPPSVPVGQIQTKRMMERQSSIGASQGAQRGRGRPNSMVRRNSSSSMTERTFRDPSPGRPATATGYTANRQYQPPVPRVPATYSNIPPVPAKSQRRSMSIDDIQLRKNNQQQQQQYQYQQQPRYAASPNPRPAPQSQSRNSMRESPSARTPLNPAAAAAKKVAGPPQAPTLTRSDSNGSVNFSYPGRSRPQSPPPPQKHFSDGPRQQAPPPRTAKSPVPVSPPNANAISQTEALRIQRELAQVAQQPVKKKKKRDGPLHEGTHFHTGVGVRSKVHPLEPGPHAGSDFDDDYEPDRSRNRTRVTGQASHFPSSPTSPNDQGHASDSDSATDSVRERRALRASGALLKQPSVVREDWEGEQGEVHSSPLPATRNRVGSRKRQGQPVATTPSRADQGQRDPATTPQSLAAPEQRNPSISPSRNTRFSNRLSSDMAQGQKHNPLPRSSSPRKPALKYSASPQGPAVERVRDSSLSASEGTDVSYDKRQSRTKKSAHVSFDSQPDVVGIAAEPDPRLVADSPIIVSPQHREQPKKWFTMSKRPQHRRNLSEDSDEDDTMKPTPQLPTFGSVRNRRNEADTSSSQPVIPSPSSSSSSSSMSSGTTPTTMNTSASSDHALGSLISRGATLPQPSQLRPTENQRPLKVEEPRARDNARKVPAPVLIQQPQQTQQVRQYQQQSSFLNKGDKEEPPSIAVQPATPGFEESLKPNEQWQMELPGGFPSVNQAVTNPTSIPAGAVYKDRSGTDGDLVEQKYEHDDQAERVNKMTSIQEESDRDSVYSDAAQNQADLDGDGFGSIAAIVHSPVASPGPQSPSYENPTPTGPQRNIEEDSAWENAGARWKGLAESAKRTSLQPSAPIVDRSSYQSRRDHGADSEGDSLPTSTESSPSTPRQRSSYHAVSTGSGYRDQQPIYQNQQPAQRAQPPSPRMQQSSPRMQQPSPRMQQPSPRAQQPSPRIQQPAQRVQQQQPAQKVQQPVYRDSQSPPRGMFRTTTPEITAKNTLQNSKRSEYGEFASKTMRNSMRNSGTPATTTTARDEPTRPLRSSMRDVGDDLPRTDAPKTMRNSMRDTGTASGNEIREEPSRPMRSSMRDSAPAAAPREDAPKPIRSSMRDSSAGGKIEAPKPPGSTMLVPARTSSGASAAALLAARQPSTGRATLQKRNPPPGAAGRKLAPLNNDSDSESSFKKKRRAKANDGGRYTMRTSMRADATPAPAPTRAPAPAQAPPTSAARRAVRSLSPVQRRPFSPAPSDQPAMRSTMRGSAGNNDAPTLRTQASTKRSSSLFGRNDARSPTRILSLKRADDSDDDRRSRPKHYKSRFQTSDDEEPDFRPVRGIPRKAKDEDSTDLEDSSDDEKVKKGSFLKKLSLSTQSPPAPTVDEPASPKLENSKKKRSFFGRMRKNKDDVAEEKEEEYPVEQPEEKVNGKRSANSAALGFSTDAERDAMVEETRRRLEARADQTQPLVMVPEPTAEARAQRLMPQRHKSDSWPLVPKISPDELERPHTADAADIAVIDTPRPALQRNSSSGTPSSPGGSSLGKAGKKKRFPMLRKAFGLKD